MKSTVTEVAICSGMDPVRIIRDENYQSDIKGLYPAGEGGGHAGGIMSSAVDGIKVAIKILEMEN